MEPAYRYRCEYRSAYDADTVRVDIDLGCGISPITDMSKQTTFTSEATQFHLPNGSPETVRAELPIEYEDDYKSMQAAGCRIELEVLRTGMVSATISSKTRDIDIRLAPNGPGVLQAVQQMLKAREWEHATEDPENS